MRIPSREQIQRIRERYPEGSRVILRHMDDVQAPPEGTLGTVQFVDDMGSVGIHWDNGSGLSAVLDGGDVIEAVVPDFTDTVRRQIMDIRASGLTNMLDVPYVQRLAFDRNFYELVNFIEDYKKEYVHFIMTGTIA